MKENLIVPIEQTFDELQERRLKEVGFIPDPNRFLEDSTENSLHEAVAGRETNLVAFKRPQIFPYATGEGYKGK